MCGVAASFFELSTLKVRELCEWHLHVNSELPGFLVFKLEQARTDGRTVWDTQTDRDGHTGADAKRNVTGLLQGEPPHYL